MTYEFCKTKHQHSRVSTLRLFGLQLKKKIGIIFYAHALILSVDIDTHHDKIFLTLMTRNVHLNGHLIQKFIKITV
jgi:hypothetical protein